LNPLQSSQREPSIMSGGPAPEHAPYKPAGVSASAVFSPCTLDRQRSIPVVQEPGRTLSTIGKDRRSRAGARRNTRAEILNRAMNVALAGIGLVLAWPIMLVFAVLIRLTSKGPIFYTQARVGLDRRRSVPDGSPYDRRTRDLGGRPFMILKFRSMRTDAETNGAVWAAKQDTRVTPIGRVMRKYRIDELPQLINVLRGDMNIVGPRPERPSIFSRLCDDIAEYPLRQRARPGITGLAQVNQAYDTSIDDVRTKVGYDLQYIERQGVTEDLLIMARTVPVMIFRKGGW
jgi:lipopolysaccharide/colanic/teichoic acid biosynthesis glycosyltransferase